MALAQLCWAQGGPMEPYSVRPDIRQVVPRAHPELGTSWERLKRGQIEAVAQLLELYPDHDIYFVARDAELLYDAALLAARDEPSLAARLHLLNVSRASAHSPHLLEYLAQEGITKAALMAGKKMLIVDTGFVGSISREIGQRITGRSGFSLKSHLICSVGSEHPSSRVFLTALNPAAPDLHPTASVDALARYEFMPRYTGRSSDFERIEGRWQPMSAVNSPNVLTDDGLVSPASAQAYMEDLAHSLQDPKVLGAVARRRAQWRTLMSLALSGQKLLLKNELRALAINGDRTLEAMVRDFVEVLSRNPPPNVPRRVSGSIALSELGLFPPDLSDLTSNRKIQMKKHPEWRMILSNTDKGVEDLVLSGRFGVLKELADSLYDPGFEEAVAKHLARLQSPSREAVEFLERWMAREDPRIMATLASSFFAAPGSAYWGAAPVLRYIELADQEALGHLVEHGLSKPHSAAWGEEVLLKLIRKEAEKRVISMVAELGFAQGLAEKTVRSCPVLFGEFNAALK
ncbi:MAG: hypothetical protein ACK5QT_02475 [Oligoflexia bacterium]